MKSAISDATKKAVENIREDVTGRSAEDWARANEQWQQQPMREEKKGTNWGAIFLVLLVVFGVWYLITHTKLEITIKGTGTITVTETAEPGRSR